MTRFPMAVIAMAATAAGSAWAHAGEGDGTNAGDRPIDRIDLQNFSDFEDVSLEDLTGDRRLRFTINLFGDVLAVATTEDEPSHVHFALGQLGLFMAADLESSMRTLCELVFEPGADGRMGVDLERVGLRWSRGKLFVAAGRSHTDLGFWNAAYHHGAWLELPIDRPKLVAFEDDGGLLPVHSVGVDAGYAVAAGAGTVHVSLGVANGRGQTVDDIRMVDDTNDAKSLRLGIHADDVAARGLRVGLGVLYDRIAAAPAEVRPALPDTALDEAIGAVDVVYRRAPFTLISEGYAILHSGGGQSFRTLGGFATAGYRVSPRLTLYTQLETLAVGGDGASPFFVPDPATSSLADEHEAEIGFRLETSPWSALKAEYEAEYKPDAPRGERLEHVMAVQWAFGI